MRLLHIDCETFSELDLSIVGLDNYAKDPSTKVLMIAYAYDDEEVQLWESHSGAIFPVPDAVLFNPEIKKIAWNSTFERVIFKNVLHKDIPVEQWTDPMIQARYASMPGGLDEVGEILNIDFKKMDLKYRIDAKKEKRYVELFSLPQKMRKSTCPCPKCIREREELRRAVLAKIEKENANRFTKKGILRKVRKPAKTRLILKGFHEGVILDYNTNSEEWKDFGRYCVRDVESEREIFHTLTPFFSLPETEMQGWYLDQRINDRGIPVNILAIANGLHIACKEKLNLATQIKELTGVENSNSPPQMIKWLSGQGYQFTSIGKDFVNKSLADPLSLTPVAIQVLKLRQQASRTSHKKLEALLSQASSDSRIRYAFGYLGASRSGRWSSHGIQLQNLRRPIKELEIEGKLEEALSLMEFGDYEGIKANFKANPLDVIGSCIRSVFQAPKGYEFLACDLASIENRVLAWLAWLVSGKTQSNALKVFEDNLDPYVSFGCKIYNKPYDKVTKEERQICKPVILGAGYGLSGGHLANDKDGNEFKTGLWGYAENMGVKISQEEAASHVKLFRKTYPEIPSLWYAIENAAKECIESGRTVKVGPLTFEYHKHTMRIILPSGRALHYLNARIISRAFKKDEYSEEQYRDSIAYDGMAHVGKGEKQITKWGVVFTYGSKISENAVQAISRDLLLYGMIEAEKMDLPCVLHCHDEQVCLVRKDSGLTVEDLRKCMIKNPEWASDLPLDAAGFKDVIYRKG